MQYSDLTEGNFDKLFDAASEEQLDNIKVDGAVTYRRRPNGRGHHHRNAETNHRDCIKSYIDPGFTSDYSSPGASPSSHFEFFSNIDQQSGRKRRSIDFSQLTLDLTSPNDSLTSWSRLRAQKKLVDSTPSTCTMSSDSSTDSLSPDSDRTTLRVTMRASLPPSDSSRHNRLRRSSALSHSNSLDGEIMLNHNSDDGRHGRSRTSSLTILDDVIDENSSVDHGDIAHRFANLKSRGNYQLALLNRQYHILTIVLYCIIDYYLIIIAIIIFITAAVAT